MSKRLRNLLVIGLFIVSMAIVILVLMLTQPKEEPDDSTPTDSQAFALLGHERDDIAEMTITNDNGSFTVRNGAEGFIIDEISEFRQNSTTLGAAANCVAALTVQTLAEENAQDLEKYGLADGSPKASCEVKLRDGSSYTVYYGIDSPDANARYVRLSDSRDVYTVLLNSSNYFYNRKEDYVSLVITEELSNNNTTPTLDYMTVTRKDLDYEIKFEDDTKNYSADEISMASSQVMVEPVFAYLDITNSNDIMYGLWGLTAYDIVCLHPTEEDFKKYGLADPFCTVHLDAELQVYHLDIGDVAQYVLDDTGAETSEPALYYVYFEGIDIIYTVTKDEVPYVDFMPQDIISNMMTSNYIYSLDYIDIDYDDAFSDPPRQIHYLFEMVSSVDDREMTVGTLDGRPFDFETFKILYQFMLKCPNDDICLEDPPEDRKICEIVYHCYDGDQDTVEFYDTGANRVTVKLNGHTSFSQPKNYLNVLLQNVEAFKNGASADELQEIW